MNRIDKIVCAAFAMLFLFVSGGCRAFVPSDTLEIHMIDVGEADCFLVKQGDTACLIDGGEADDADNIVTYLHTHGVERLDGIVISHPHIDHIGGLQRVIEAYEVNTVYYAAVPKELQELTPLHERLYDASVRRGTAWIDVGEGGTVSLGEATMEFYPVTVDVKDVNEYSLMVRVSFDESQVLFTGDAGSKAHRAVLDSGADIRADVIKMAHHGAYYATNEAFLKAVGAQAALISCGVENEYGHPDKRTLELLEKNETVSYRSDLCGDTVVTMDRQGIRFIEATR